MSKHYKKVRNCLAVLLICLVQTVFAQQVTVSGKITSADDGLGLPGVNVFEKGTTNGAVSDADGNYTISVAVTGTLAFSFVGYQTQEVVVNGQTTINISLQIDATVLSEIVVVGYGSQKKADITGAIVQVKGEEFTKQASINPISALQGKVAGVQITNSGAPGASPQVRIRGTGTIGGGSNPLYVVDGVWYSDISFLNPADIQNLSVLKDASSQAIYGVRAANGVIIITTKRGTKSTSPKITYDGFVGSQVITNPVEMATGPQYATLINELDAANGVTPRYADPSAYGTTDWYRQIMRSALISNHNVGISGGGDKSTFNLSVGYLKQDGTVETNSFDRYTIRLQNDFEPAKFFKAGYTITGAMNKSNDIDGGIFHQMYAASPITPVYYSDGTYGDPNDFGAGSSNLFNPQATIDYFDQQSKNYRFTGNMYAELKFAKNFTFRTSASADFGQNEVKKYAPVYTATLSQRNTTSVLSLNRGENRNWMLENTLTYANQIATDHFITAMIGQSAQSYTAYNLAARAENVPNTSDGDHYFSLGNNYNLSDGGNIRKVASYFARVNYSFKEKYILTATYRADGLSEFVGNDRWGYFPSIGAGWVISEESFMQDQSIFNFMKLRASWGKNGNNEVPSQPAVLTVTQSNDYMYVGGNGAISPGASIVSLVPPSVVWEKTEGTDVGLEAGLMNNKLTVELDWYNRKTIDAIFDIPVLGTIGTQSGTIVGNQASIQNRGFELAANWNDQITENLSFSIGANFGINNNKVLEVSTGENPIYKGVGTTGGAFNTRTVVNQPIGQFFGYKVIGIFQSDDDINAYQSTDGDIIQSTANPGDFKYADLNDDGVIDGKDRTIIGNPNPKFIYGINTTWQYKRFDLTVDMQGIMGVDVYNAELGYRFGTENFTRDFYNNRWHGEGTSNTYPSANIGGGQNYLSNSFFVESGSYFRVRNLQLGYTVPASVTSKLKINSVRVYANAQNALNIFKYRGFNPEVGGKPTEAGVDSNVYPLYATYNLGFNIKF
jgi:TonB-linked SusC/RagA family outer membrane protein